ncbi:hypothetical protein Tco_0185616 [Tanacetum coccineum]
MERCYALIGYPVGFKRNPNLSRQYGNYNKRFNANCEVNQSALSTSGSLSSSFTNEQMIIDSGANQHMTDSTRDMSNVVDISSLMLTVGHPNDTLTKISAIGSLKLSSGIVLFDVLVILEYNVSLLYVNKMIKDSKFFVGFGENKCYIQDLNHGKIVGLVSLFSLVCNDKFGVRDVKFYENVFPFKLNSSNDFSNSLDKSNKCVNGLNESGEHNLNFFDAQSPIRPYDEEGDTYNVDGNIGVNSDDCNITVEDEVAVVATQIEDNVTSEGNVQTNQNGEGLSNI